MTMAFAGKPVKSAYDVEIDRFKLEAPGIATGLVFKHGPKQVREAVDEIRRFLSNGRWEPEIMGQYRLSQDIVETYVDREKIRILTDELGAIANAILDFSRLYR